MKYRHIIGLTGVNQQENARALKVGRFLSYFVFIALLAVIVQLVMDISDQVEEAAWLSLSVWGIFTLEFAISLALVDDRWRYVRQNWMNLLIILLTIPWIEWGGIWAAVFRSVRLVLFFRVFLQVFGDVLTVLKRNSFGMVLVVAVVFVFISGATFALIEGKDFATGLWYSLVTVTTVGYGDVTPVTEEGRVFGAFLIILGVVLFSLVTANISAFLVGAEQKKMERQMMRLLQKTEARLELEGKENEKVIAHLLEQMDRRLSQVEKNISVINQSQLKEELFEIKQMLKRLEQKG